MLIMINGDNKMNMKHDNVRIIRIINILDLHGVIVDSRTVVLFEYEQPLLSWVGKWWIFIVPFPKVVKEK